MSAAQPFVEVTGVAKSYGPVRALDDVGMAIGEGEILALLGPNGAGKTTLVSLVAGLLRPDRGTVRVAGLDPVTNAREVHRKTGLAPQELGLYPRISVRRNLQAFARLAGLGGRPLDRRVTAAAEALDVAHLLDRPAGSLSGGEKRRVHTAVALVHEPRLLLLDEPTAGADVATRGRILELVQAKAAVGCSICYSTHYLPEVEQLPAYVVVLDHGQVLATGSVDDLVRRHARTTVELRFDGGPMDLRIEHTMTDDGAVRVETEDPGRVVAAAFAEASAAGAAVRSVDVVRPSLEAAYVAIVGQGAAGAGSPDVVAAP